MKISKEEYKRLVDRDNKLDALESGGVDNWEFYGDALDAYNAEKELENDFDTMWEEMESTLGEAIDEPAGHGCGYGFCGDESAVESAQMIVKRFISDHYIVIATK